MEATRLVLMSRFPFRRRRPALVFLCLAALAGLFSGAAISAGWTDERSPKPAIHFLKLNPLEVRGANFKPSERVTVVAVYAGLKRTRRTRADGGGRFIVRFGKTVKLGGCGPGAQITARGSLGSVAVRKILPRMCLVQRFEVKGPQPARAGR